MSMLPSAIGRWSIPSISLALLCCSWSATAQATRLISEPQARLQAADAEPEDYFGQSVVLRGNSLLIGSPYADVNGNVDAGKVYLWERDTQGNWNPSSQLDAGAQGQEGDSFGVSMAVSGSTLVVGASEASSGSSLFTGAAYIFKKNGQGQWTFDQRIVANDARSDVAFGDQVAIENNLMAITAPRDDSSAILGGSVYIFERTSAAQPWRQVAKLSPPDPQTGDLFGISVAIKDGLIAVGANGRAGAPLESNPQFPAPAAGNVFIYQKGALRWEQRAVLMVEKGQPLEGFGTSLAFSDNGLIIGAPGYDIVRENGSLFRNVGRAYEFRRSGNSWTQGFAFTPVQPRLDESFGYAISSQGGRVLISSSSSDESQFGEGIAQVFEQRNGQWELISRLQSAAGDTRPKLGYGTSVALEGNTAVVGATLAENASSLELGAVFVFDPTQGKRDVSAASLMPLWMQLWTAMGLCTLGAGLYLSRRSQSNSLVR